MTLFQPFLEKSGGCVINVSCLMGHKAAQGAISYCMSKAGLEMLTKAAALELAPMGVRVNAVAPSLCDTNMYRYSGLSENEFEGLKDRAEDSAPFHRIVLPEEVAKAIVFLSSDSAKRITGHVMKVDGGKSLTSLSTVDWYGGDVMNRRFEVSQGGVSKLKYYWKKVKHAFVDPAKGAPVGSTDWIAAHQTSNWATHSEEAHEKVKLDYGAYRIDNDKNLEYERANMWGGSNNPAKAEHRTFDRYSHANPYGRNTRSGSRGRDTHGRGTYY